MQLVHLTDLHYQHNQPFQKALISALLDDLTKKISEGWSPDAIVFSGDLVRNPDDPDIFARFEEQFLVPVLERCKVGQKNVVFCPGNHDVSFKAVGEWSDTREKLKAALAGPQDALSQFLKTGPVEAYARAISSGFYDLAARYGQPWSSPYVQLYSFPYHKTAFIALSTAFGCGLEGSAHDRGKLAVPADQLLAAFQAVANDYRSITTMHHTLADLSETASRVVSPLIERKADAHFYGHVHHAKPSAVTAVNGECFLVQGGALYEDKGVYNCYSFVNLGPKRDRAVAHYRTYWPDRDSFDVGTNVEKDGTFYSSAASKEYWQTVVPPPKNDDVCYWLMENQATAFAELDKTITTRTLSDTFIDPVITRKSDNGEGSATRVATAQFLTSTDHIVLSCEGEYGSTALLSYLTMQFYSECITLPQAKVPCLVDARNVKGAYPAAIESALRSSLPDSTEIGFKLASLHDNGRIVVLIDNVDPANQIHQDFVSGVRSSFPKARLIVSIKLPFVDTNRLRPIIGIDKFVFMQLRTLTRGKVRALVEKWKLPSAYDVDAVVDEIETKFSALGIPQTAAYVVIYLSVIEEIDGFNPINSSTVIEQFVESALQKYKPVYVFRSSFDYRNQIDYLGIIAERMCRKNSFVIEYEELYQWTKEHFDHIGQDHDLSKLISHFVESKVFAHEGNSVYFRYNIFLSFFIAHRLRESTEFRGWLLDSHRYTQYVSEIDIYCGLSRNDAEMIDFFSREVEAHEKKLAGYVTPLAWTDRLEKLTLPIVKKSETVAFAEGIENQLTSNMPAEKRDEAVTGGQDHQKAVKPTINRPEVMGVVPLWIMALRAYSVALKNLENLPKDEKERHLRNILNGWSTVMLYACIVFKEAIESKSVEVGPIKFSIQVPEGMDARVLRMFFVHIPVFISEWLRRDLGSQKLALQLKNDSIPQSLSDHFLQTSLYSDLKLPEYLAQLEGLRKKITDADSQSFMEFLLVKMRALYLRLGLQHNEEGGFLKIAAELSADIKGLKGEERAKEIERYTTDLRRSGQVKQMKDNFG